MIRITLGIVIVILYSTAIFLIGFSQGNVKGQRKSVNNKLTATEDLMKAQGSSPQEIKATIDYLKAQELSEIGSVKRTILSIWLPSVLVIINMILTIWLKNIK